MVSNNQTQVSPKPYKLVSLPRQAPRKQKPFGQDAFQTRRLSGKISLRLTIKTSAFVASGIVAMGSDVSQQARNIPLIKLAVEKEQKIVLPGSSLKGAIRSTYEAITQSCLCKTKVRKEQIPQGYSECKDKAHLCPACQVFGAMGWQGLISFQDAVATSTKPSVGFMPSLYAPRPNRQAYYRNGKVAGRKFYYHAARAVDRGQQRGIPVRQAGTDCLFTTQIRFMNLSEAELGALLIILGQDRQHPIALKVGGGKPIGMGTVTVEITEIDCPQNLRDRYLSYIPNSEPLTRNELSQFISKSLQAARQHLVQPSQLQELAEVLAYPTDRQPPEGLY